MVFIIGGKSQGKSEFMKELANSEIKLGEEILFDEVKNAKAIDGLELLILRMINDGHSDEQIFNTTMSFSGEYISSAEIGGGVVSMEASERRYVELVGRISCEMAKRSDVVYRMYCGMTQKIKG